MQFSSSEENRKAGQGGPHRLLLWRRCRKRAVRGDGGLSADPGQGGPRPSVREARARDPGCAHGTLNQSSERLLRQDPGRLAASQGSRPGGKPRGHLRPRRPVPAEPGVGPRGAGWGLVRPPIKEPFPVSILKRAPRRQRSASILSLRAARPGFLWKRLGVAGGRPDLGRRARPDLFS